MFIRFCFISSVISNHPKVRQIGQRTKTDEGLLSDSLAYIRQHPDQEGKRMKMVSHSGCHTEPSQF